MGYLKTITTIAEEKKQLFGYTEVQKLYTRTEFPFYSIFTGRAL
jgi:hypothetical protein